MRIDLILAPYDSGQIGRRWGLGPLALIEAGLPARLAALGHETTRTLITVPDHHPCEAGTGIRVAARISEQVRQTLDENAFPLVLAGNCLSSVGTISGARADGVLWCDAHADLNSPETSPSGFVDGMALATAMGRAWPLLTRTVPGFRPIDPDKVVLYGVREFDPPEMAFVEEHAIPVTTPETIDAALDRLAARVERAYLHFDLDVHDVSEFRANAYAIPNGPTAAEVRRMIAAAARRLAPVAVAVTAYDPAFDPERRVAEAAIAALETFFTERV